MTSPEKRKGDDFERRVMRFLEDEGFKPWRPRAGYPHDVGDIVLDYTERITFQCKAFKNLAEGIRQGLAGAKIQAVNAQEELSKHHFHFTGVTVVKRRNRPTGEALVALTLSDFCELMKRLDDR
jgi:hypothetical protein